MDQAMAALRVRERAYHSGGPRRGRGQELVEG